MDAARWVESCGIESAAGDVDVLRNVVADYPFRSEVLASNISSTPNPNPKSFPLPLRRWKQGVGLTLFGGRRVCEVLRTRLESHVTYLCTNRLP